MIWTEDLTSKLIDAYSKHGKKWCIDNLGLTEAQVRQKASRLKLRARGVSDAWNEKNKRHADILRGRKRPEQADVIRRLRSEGKLNISEERKKAVGERMRKYIADNGHPRGMLGLKHSEETKLKISEKSRKSQAERTQEQWHAIILKGMHTKSQNGTYVKERKKASWKSGWRKIGAREHYYRSRWEANYARYLNWLQSIGQIKSWDHEPETFWFESVKRGSVSYLPDFRVIENSGQIVFHEVKGWMDQRSRTKIKRMRIYHPNVKLIVVDSKAYKAIARSVSKAIEGWE